MCKRYRGHISGYMLLPKETLTDGKRNKWLHRIFANKYLFDAVNEIAKEKECLFTLYVDDLTISGNAATKSLINDVRNEIKRHGLSTKRKKTQTFSSHSAKTITGVVIKGNQCLLPNQRHKNIDDTRIAIQNSSDVMKKEQLKKSLNGRLLEARRIKDYSDGVKDLYPSLIDY